MSLAFLNVFDTPVAQHIMAFVPLPPTLDIHQLFGSTTIYRTKHYITYGGGPEGGFVYFTVGREQGWYEWSRDWFQEPKYEKIENGQVAFLVNDDGSEGMVVLPEGWEDTVDIDELAETVIIADDAHMEEMEALT